MHSSPFRNIYLTKDFLERSHQRDTENYGNDEIVGSSINDEAIEKTGTALNFPKLPLRTIKDNFPNNNIDNNFKK